MGIKLPGNLYTGGAVTFNSQPEVNFYAQLLQKKQAKQDALNQFYQKEISDTTSAGMRNKDVVGGNGVRGWADDLNDWQEFAMNPENRKYLLNPRLDGYKTQTQFNQMHTDLLNKAAASKNELKDAQFMEQQQANPKRQWTDGDMEIMHRKGLSIYDPARLDANGNQPDLTQLSLNQPPFTPLLESQTFNAASHGIKPSKVRDETNQTVNNQTGEVYTPWAIKRTPEQVKTIADNYGSLLTKAASDHYENLMNDQTWYSQMTPIYQSVYGKTNPDGSTNLMDTPRKAAQAYAILHANSEVETGQDKETNRDLLERWKQKNIMLNKTPIAAGTSQGNAFDSMEDNKYQNFDVKGGAFYNKDGSIKGSDKPEQVFVTKDQLPAVIPSILKANNINPFLIGQGVTATIKDGKIQSIENPKIGVIDRGTMENVMQRKYDTEPLKATHLQFSNPASNQPAVAQPTNIPAGTRAEWKASGWTDAQINERKKQGRIKVKGE